MKKTSILSALLLLGLLGSSCVASMVEAGRHDSAVATLSPVENLERERDILRGYLRNIFQENSDWNALNAMIKEMIENSSLQGVSCNWFPDVKFKENESFNEKDGDNSLELDLLIAAIDSYFEGSISLEIIDAFLCEYPEVINKNSRLYGTPFCYTLQLRERFSFQPELNPDEQDKRKSLLKLLVQQGAVPNQVAYRIDRECLYKKIVMPLLPKWEEYVVWKYEPYEPYENTSADDWKLRISQFTAPESPGTGLLRAVLSLPPGLLRAVLSLPLGEGIALLICIIALPIKLVLGSCPHYITDRFFQKYSGISFDYTVLEDTNKTRIKFDRIVNLVRWMPWVLGLAMYKRSLLKKVGASIAVAGLETFWSLVSRIPVGELARAV